MNEATAQKIQRALEGIERVLRDQLALERRLEARPMFVFVPTQWSPEEVQHVAQQVAAMVGWTPPPPEDPNA